MFCYNLMNVLVWTRSYSPQTTGEYISEVCFVTIWWTYLYEQDLTLHKQLENIYQRYVLLQSDERTCMNQILLYTNNWRIYIRGMFCYNLMNVLVWTRSYSPQTTGEYISEVCFVTIWWKSYLLLTPLYCHGLRDLRKPHNGFGG
jgi:D-mannonate dehydratase